MIAWRVLASSTGAIESLIHSGALDALEPDGNRAQLMADLDLLLDWASSRACDRASGQGNLLDLLGGGSEQKQPAQPGLGPSGGRARLRPQEVAPKELVGLLLHHPLKQLQDTRRLLMPAGPGAFEQADRQRVSTLVMVPEMRVVSSKAIVAILQIGISPAVLKLWCFRKPMPA